MIAKISKLKGAGIFLNFKWDDTVLPAFGRYNLIYGWNGSGKTTLSKVLACIETGQSEEFPGLQYDIETETGTFKEGNAFDKKVRVFNQDYVQKNVHPRSGKANSIFILGEDNKAISEQVASDQAALSDLENKKRTLEEERDKKNIEKGKKFTAIASVIGANLVGSSTRNYRKPDAERDFQSMSDLKILDDAEVSRQQLVIKQEQKDKISKVNLDFELDLSALHTEVAAICNETVESKVIERLSGHPEISEWIESGLSIHGNNPTSCEFCGQIIPTGRIEALLGHFNEADKKLKSKIEARIASLQEFLQAVQNRQIPNKAQFYNDLQPTFSSRAISYNQEKDSICAELLALIEVLGNKRQKTTEALPFSGSTSSNFKKAVASLNELGSRLDDSLVKVPFQDAPQITFEFLRFSGVAPLGIL